MKLNVKSDDIQFGENILKVKVPKALRNRSSQAWNILTLL